MSTTHKLIADAVKTTIEALTSPPTVVVRAQYWRVDGDTLPLVIVTMGGRRQIGAATNCHIYEYDILISVLYSQAMVLQTGIDDARTWRDTIEDRLTPDNTIAPGAILSGVSSVYDADAAQAPPEDETLFAAGYETSRLLMVYRTIEAAHA